MRTSTKLVRWTVAASLVYAWAGYVARMGPATTYVMTGDAVMVAFYIAGPDELWTVVATMRLICEVTALGMVAVGVPSDGVRRSLIEDVSLGLWRLLTGHARVAA